MGLLIGLGFSLTVALPASGASTFPDGLLSFDPVPETPPDLYLGNQHGCGSKRNCHTEERTIHGSSGPNRDAVAGIGGGLGLLAPWPAGRTMVVGGRCGYFYHRESHRDWGGRWGDDRFAIDIGVCGGSDAGMPILAAHTGIVQIAHTDPVYGKEALIEVTDDLTSVHPDGLATRYSHLGSLTVKEGEFVLAGQQIGTLGSSGQGGGSKRNAHLHFVAYSSRKTHAGTRPEPLAGVSVCDRCRVTSLTERPNPNLAPFLSALDAQFPMDRLGEVVLKAGSAVPFGFDVRFSQPFQANRFVLRARTPDLIRRFTNLPSDFTGQPSKVRRNVGEFRAALDAPAGTPAGLYTLKWEVIDRDTGRLGNLRLPIQLKVLPPSASNPATALTPCPPDTAQSLGPRVPSPLSASLDAEFPQDVEGRVHVSRGDTVPFGFNIRFNTVFSPAFVLKPNTVSSVVHFVPPFGTPGNVFPGAIAPNDDHVGYYRSSVTTPLCTPSGSYFVQWRVVDRNSGNEAALEPSLVVTVP